MTSQIDPVFSGAASASTRRDSAGAWFIVGIALAAALTLIVLGYLAWAFGLPAVAVGALLALVPLAIVLWAIRWVDRWEPEPRWALWFAALWGAGVSVAAALVVDAGVQLTAAIASPGSTPDAAAQAVIQAPIVEEIAKGVGVLLLFVFAKSRFDGPVDGLVYGATVAAGFAFTENILYFGQTLIEGDGASLGYVFVVRGLFSPFAHVLFTACAGLALGVAARRGAHAGGVFGWFVVGLAGAIALHALWNGSMLFADGVVLYVLVQVPIFIAAIVVTVGLRRADRRITRLRLGEYARAGWFSADEVEGLSTSEGRRRALAWGAAQRPPRTAAVRDFTTAATRLALTRQVIDAGRADVRRLTEEHELLDAVTEARARIVG